MPGSTLTLSSYHCYGSACLYGIRAVFQNAVTLAVHTDKIVIVLNYKYIVKLLVIPGIDDGAVGYGADDRSALGCDVDCRVGVLVEDLTYQSFERGEEYTTFDGNACTCTTAEAELLCLDDAFP